MNMIICLRNSYRTTYCWSFNFSEYLTFNSFIKLNIKSHANKISCLNHEIQNLPSKRQIERRSKFPLDDSIQNISY